MPVSPSYGFFLRVLHPSVSDLITHRVNPDVMWNIFMRTHLLSDQVCQMQWSRTICLRAPSYRCPLSFRHGRPHQPCCHSQCVQASITPVWQCGRGGGRGEYTPCICLSTSMHNSTLASTYPLTVSFWISWNHPACKLLIKQKRYPSFWDIYVVISYYLFEMDTHDVQYYIQIHSLMTL